MIRVGEYLGRGKDKRKILDVVPLSNGWFLVKTENSKSAKDFKVRTITDPISRKYYTPKHAHFAIDLYGKLCHDKAKAEVVFKAIIEVWQGQEVAVVLQKYAKEAETLPGYKSVNSSGWKFQKKEKGAN